MSSAILNSNASSALIASLDSVSSAKNPYIYSYAQKGTLGAAHIPAHSRCVVVSQPTGIAGFGTNIDLPVIKAGMLENSFIKLVFTNNTGAAAYPNQAFMNLMVEEISLMTAGKVLCSSRPFGRACLMSNKPYEVKKNMEKMFKLTAGRVAWANGTSETAYIPLCFSCFESPELNYNTNFVEPLVVRVRLAAANSYLDDNGNAAVGHVAATPLTIASCSLVQVHRTLPSDLTQKQIASNYSDTESLVRVQPYDLVEENTVKNCVIGDNTISHTFTTNRVMTKLFIGVENLVSQVANAIDSYDEGNYMVIKSVKLTGNGQQIIGELDGDILKHCLIQDTDTANSAFGVGNGWDTNAPPHTQNILQYQFDMSKDPSHITSAFSSREVADLTVSVTFTAASATNHRLRVCLLSPFLESINSASGKISTSLSS